MTNTTDRGRCLADIIAEQDGVSRDVVTARSIVGNWHSADWHDKDQDQFWVCESIITVCGDKLPDIAAQCKRDDDIDKAIRIAARHYQRTEAAV